MNALLQAVAVGVAVALAHAHVSAAETAATLVDLAKGGIGNPPADFEFQRTGEGDLGRWIVMRDPSAIGGHAIEHVSTDQHDDRFPLAIYKLLVGENVDVSVRFKIVSGTMQSAGLALGVRTPNDYYAVSASALEHNVALLLFVDGKSERIDSAEAEVTLNRWHTMGVVIDDDHVKVSLNQKLLFTTYDWTRRKDGRVALWTQEDNVSQFHQLKIRELPRTRWQ